jgi:tryptophan synthase alpha chain
VTGAGERLSLDHQNLFSQLTTLGAPPPVLGFGISTPDHVQQALRAGAAGVISGSAIIQLLGRADGADKVSDFVRRMKQATKLKPAL